MNRLENILEKIEINKISTYELAKKTGLTITGIDKIIKKTTKKPNGYTLDLIEKAINEKVNTTSYNVTTQNTTASEPLPEYKTLKTIEMDDQRELIESLRYTIELLKENNQYLKNELTILKTELYQYKGEKK